MRSVYVYLPTAEVVQDFVEQISELKGNVDLIHENYILDARSLMGILSLDLSKPIRLDMEQDNEKNINHIKKFIVDAPEKENTDGR